MSEQPIRAPSPRLAGSGRRVYVSTAFALTEPGPAAFGVVVADEQGQILAHRAQYLGQSERQAAGVRALLFAARLAVQGRLESPRFLLDDRDLVAATRNLESLPDGPELAEALGSLPGYRVEPVAEAANLARPVALAPLVDWLPERTRRAERLVVERLADDTYEVSSASQTGQRYRVLLPRPGGAASDQPLQCECADFQYRGIPCKHLLAVARELGGPERLFYPERAGSG